MQPDNEAKEIKEKMRGWAQDIQRDAPIQALRGAMEERKKEFLKQGPNANEMVSFRENQLEAENALLKLEAAYTAVYAQRGQAERLTANAATLIRVPELVEGVEQKLTDMGIEKTPKLATALKMLSDLELTSHEKQKFSVAAAQKGIGRH